MINVPILQLVIYSPIKQAHLITVELKFIPVIITPMLCSDTKTMTHLAGFDQTNLGRQLAIPHFCLDLKLSDLNVILTGGQGKNVQSCPG